MPQIIAISGLLLILALGAGGGIGVKSTNAQPEAGRVLVSGGETASPSTVTNSSTNKTKTKSTTGYLTKATSQPQVVDTRLPKVTTIAAQNIGATSATLRAQVDSYAKKGERVFVVYGYDESSVRNLVSKYKSFDSIPKFTNDKVRVRSIDTSISVVEKYSTPVTALIDKITYFYTYCFEYDGGLTCGSVRSFKTVEANYRSDKFNRPTISLSPISKVEAYSAEVSGSYKMNDGENGTVFLVYGADKALINSVLKVESYSDVKENGGNLQKVRLAARAIGTGSFSYIMDDVDNDTQYHYRVCVEHDSDDAEGVVCSSVRSFTTDRRDTTSKPTTSVGDSMSMGRSVVLTGSVQMNDFNDGHAFFVYGKNETSVQNSAKSTKFTAIRQSGDNLQLVSIDTDVDGSQVLSKTVRDLLPATKYFYRSCVEYVDDNDRGYETLYLSCSVVKSFTTGL